jgi:uncharacterized membrane protein YgcG
VTKFALRSLCAVALLVSVGASAQAEVKRKRYTFDLNPKTRRASLARAQGQARQAFLREYLAEKFSKEIVDQYTEDIDIALDPPEDYLLRFDVVSEKPNADETQVTITVEGEVATAPLVAKLVEQKVLSFGDSPPKIMVLPSSRFENPSSAKKVRALIYDQVKQSGLRPVAFEGITDVVSIQVRPGGQLSPDSKKILIRKAQEYGADYLVYIDTEATLAPFSQGGYIADTNFTYTILRPNANLILGESIISARGNGSNAMLAFDRALDEAAPELSSNMLGNLYESIYADSDVITATPQIKTQVELLVHEATPQQIQTVMDRLRTVGADINLGVGDGLVKALRLEVPMDDTQLFEWFNAQKFVVANKSFTTPVIAYQENVVEIEVVPTAGRVKRALASRPKPRTGNALAGGGKSGGAGQGTFGGGGGKGSGGAGGTALAVKAKVTLKLRPAKFSTN